METFHFAHFNPPAGECVHLSLVSNLRNADLLLNAMKAKSIGAFPLPLALIDARLITSTDHILVAVQQAMIRSSRNSLKTKSIYSEILWNLSATSNIMESFRTFGISPNTKDLLLVHIASSPEHDVAKRDTAWIFEQMKTIVEGEFYASGPTVILNAWRRTEPSNHTTQVTDWPAVVNAYRLSDTDVNGELAMSESNHEEVQDVRRRIDALVTSAVAIKFVAS